MSSGDGSNLVMVVDDSKLMVNIVSKTVIEMGYEVMAAYDGQQALTALTTQKVVLIITDLNMPIMDGLTLVDQVRKGETVNKKTPIIMVTTESDKEKILKAKELGASGYIIKPWLPEKLKAVISAIVGSKTATKAV